MNVLCGVDPCPVILPSKCVFYDGETLLFVGINTNDNLTTVIQKLADKIEECCTGGGEDITLTTLGNSGPATLVGSVLNIPVYEGFGTAVEVLGVGTCSTVRCGVNNGSSGNYSASLGGACNIASGAYSFIGGGFKNLATCACSTIVGGLCNTVCARHAFLGGGQCNCISVLSPNQHQTLSGGYCNTITGDAGTIAGGFINTVSSQNGFIGGGNDGVASGSRSIVVGGQYNTASGLYSGVMNGCGNIASGESSVIVNGFGNTAIACGSFIGTGCCNRICSSGLCSAIVGGINNTITVAVLFPSCGAFIGAGVCNCVRGAQGSVVAGTCNYAFSDNAFVGGGCCNRAFGGNSVAVGGFCNASSNCGFAGGGSFNTVSGYGAGITAGCANCSTALRSFIGAGVCNNLTWFSGGSSTSNCGIASAIVAGVGNNTTGGTWDGVNKCYTVAPTCTYCVGCMSFIGAGFENAINDGHCSVIVGGKRNYIDRVDSATIGGGCINFIQACSSLFKHQTISGGYYNSVFLAGDAGTIGGGYINTVTGTNGGIASGAVNTASANGAFVGGGYYDTASGIYSVVGGGECNVASGCYSAILGGCNNVASSCWSGAFGCNLTACDPKTFYTNNHCACGSLYTSAIATGCAVCATTNGQLIGWTPSASGARYGSFFDTTDQTALVADTAYAMKLNNTDLSAGVTVANNGLGDPTRITVDTTGVYDFQFSAQIQKTSGGSAEEIYIWIRKNNITDITNSTTVITLANNSHLMVAAWNWFVSLNAGDYIEIMWSATDTAIQLEYTGAVAPAPAAPSVIVTVNQV